MPKIDYVICERPLSVTHMQLLTGKKSKSRLNNPDTVLYLAEILIRGRRTQ